MSRPAGSDTLSRGLDVALALPAMAVAAPVIAISALVVRRRMGPPVIFRQERAGLGGRPFVLLKLRTMTIAAEGPLEPDQDAARLTPLGATLRGWSIDELPQLWNVIRGDMALVGPRPLPVAYIERYSATQRRRLEVRPGLTGLAQVSGRNTLDWDDRLALDVEYVERRSVALDLRILVRTLVAVLRREGISAQGHATMPEFLGEAGAA